MTERDVVLIDMDCFYVQVEQRLNPSLKGKPCAVVQYKTWKGGGIIAVGYEARKFGVTRQMRGDDAKLKCPDIHLARVPEIRGKADLTRYREAGAEVIAVFSKFCSCVERASVDEAFLDITTEVSQRLKAMAGSCTVVEQIPNTFVEGFEGPEGKTEWLERLNGDEGLECERRLAVAATMVEEMRAAVLKETGFTCSAGISHNKMLAKLACGRNKPNKQTVFPLSSVPTVFATLPIPKIRHLGGKLGAFLTDDLHLQHMGDLVQFSEKELQQHCGIKTGSWLFNACRGIESESVSTRELPKSIGCSKNFRGKDILDTREKVKFWLSELSKEVSERLNKDQIQNKRTAKSLTVYVRSQVESGSSSSSSRACLLARYDADKICLDAYTMIKPFNTSSSQSLQWYPPLINLGLSASKFTNQGDYQKISSMFTTQFASQQHTEDHQSVSDSNTITKEQEESYGHVNETFYAPKPIAIGMESKTKPLNTNKTSKVKQSDKHTFVSIKSFFSQKESCEEKFSNDEQNKNASSDKSTADDQLVQTNETTAKICDNSETCFSGFFATKMKSLASISADSNEVRNESADNHLNCDSFEEEPNLVNNLKISPSASLGSNNVTNGADVNVKDNRSSFGFSEWHSKSKTSLSPVTSNLKAIAKHSEIDVQSEKLVNFNTNRPSCSSESVPSATDSHRQVLCFSDSTVSNEDFIECNLCKELISVWEMPEHNDYHFALDLQKEVNGKHTESSNSTGSSTNLTHSGKRKVVLGSNKSIRSGKKSKGGTKDKNVQPLTAFFSKT
ncbi:DNA polymerase eta-like [Plakobranchus ocellatus]|uniref:DNA polymerase eta n=1 Tax=Plakobranchus ocellatus TaxID=259542 RepID=A0AAV3ZPH9_9GAST|nr:DNA polymerase eta-like [Plakobranchus ocellatus]